MTREEKCKLAIEKGYTYNPETGNIIGPKGNILIAKCSYGYINIMLTTNNKRYSIKAHQFGWFIINNEIVKEIDHINGNRIDNRIINLRSVSHQENAFNIKKTKGYTFDKINNKFKTQIKLNGKNINLGRYDNEDDARQAYLQAKEKYHTIDVRTTD